MGYSEQFEIVKNAIITQSKDALRENWLQMFDMWLSCEADWEFAHIYKSAFNKEFSKYMTTDIETLLWLSGKNIVFAIGTYMSSKEDATLEDILDFTENFLLRQLDDFDNWCDDIGMAMYEESSDCERDNAIIAENVVATIDISANTLPIIDLSGNTLHTTDISENTLHTMDLSGTTDLSRVIDISTILHNLPKEVIKKIKSNISGNNLKDMKQSRRKGDLTYNEFIDKIKKQNGKCYICLQDFKYDGGKWCNFFPSADRIYNYNIHTNTNVAISCIYCNIRYFKDSYTGKETQKICGMCPGLNHIYEDYIPTKSLVFKSLGNNNERIYEYAQNPYEYYLQMTHTKNP